MAESDAPLPIAKPVIKAPTTSKSPPAGRQFPCLQCGARLDFNPAARGLKCPYCGYHQEIERGDRDEIEEKDYRDYLSREESKGKAIEGRSTETKCTGCGAIVLLEDKVATEKCPFCATHLETKPEAAHAMVAPESLLPFKVDLREAREAFTQWLHSLWFAPNALKKAANLGQLTGVYLPYWTYDAMTYTFYEGQRGDNYSDTEYYTATRSDGSTEQRTRTVTRIRWYSVSGEVRNFFDDVLVCGSTSLPESLITDLGDWNLEKLEPFNASYLSGFKTERYAIGLKEGLKIAKDLMQPTIDNLIRQDIGGDHQTISSKQTRYSAITFKHVLLPVWVAVYRFQNQTFQILVNGRTARVTGYRPYSYWKIAGLVGGIVIFIILMTLLIMKIQGG